MINWIQKSIVLSYFIVSVMGCQESVLTKPSSQTIDPDEGKYHENSFFMDPLPGAALAKTASAFSKKTNYNSETEYQSALNGLILKLKDKSFRKSLDVPLDYYCRDVDLAIRKQLGEVSINGKVYFNDSVFHSHCEKKRDEMPLAKSAGLTTLPDRTVWNTQYPYRLVGHSWSNEDYGVYKSTGGETMFEKRRSKYFTTAWWGLDANLIGIRIYLFECPKVDAAHPFSKLCFDSVNRSYSDWDSNDDYVSVRDWAVGIKASFSLNGWLPTGLKFYDQPQIEMYAPDPMTYYTKDGREIVYLGSTAVNWAQGFLDFTVNLFLPSYSDYHVKDAIPFINGLQAYRVPQITGNANEAGIANGVLSMHSVKHGSMNFRAISSNGLRPNLVYKWSSLNFVTW